MIALFATLLVGILSLALSMKGVFQARKPMAVLKFESGSHEFEIKTPGDYSISIFGAGSIQGDTNLDIQLVLEDQWRLKVTENRMAPRFSLEGNVGIEYWRFSTTKAGRCVLTLANLEDVIAKDSMLWSKAQFQSPNDHRRLKLLVAQSVEPLHRTLSLVGFVVGGAFVIIGLFMALGKLTC